MTTDVSTASWFSLVAASAFPDVALLGLAGPHRSVGPQLTQELLVSWNRGLPRTCMVGALMLEYRLFSVIRFTCASLPNCSI